MAKKTISRLSVLAVLIVFLAACSKTSEYTNVIPADASVVASINLKSLASKAGLDDKENEAAKQKVLEALKSGMNAATFQQLEKVMKNPGESGIDVESPFYVFSSSSFPYPTVVGKVNNEDKLHASLDVMAKEQIDLLHVFGRRTFFCHFVKLFYNNSRQFIFLGRVSLEYNLKNKFLFRVFTKTSVAAYTVCTSFFFTDFSSVNQIQSLI